MDEGYYALINYYSSPERSNFTKEEERLILKLLVLFGNRWSEIATHFPGRTHHDISNYWNTRARRTILKQVDLLVNPMESNFLESNFTKEEERLIIKLRLLVGNSWSEIAIHFPGRTDHDIWNYWNTRVRRTILKQVDLLVGPMEYNPTTESLSDFVDYITKLSCEEPTSSSYMRVFWSEEECLHSPFKEQILSVLRQIPFINYPDEENPNLLVQYWAPTIIEGQRFLTTSQQPFAVANLTSSFGSYRMHSMSCTVNVDGGREEELGPIGRVFRSGIIESSSNVRYYSINEYPHQDLALRCGIRSTLALPVFQSSIWSCVGVLEFVSTFGDMQFVFDSEYISNMLEGSDLVVPVLPSEKILNSPALSNEQSEMIFQNINYKKVLEELCQIHELPLAGTWFTFRHDSAVPCGGDMEKNCNNLDMICTREVVMPGLFRFLNEDDLYYAYHNFLLTRDQGLVGKALLSRKPYFCRDITQLSIIKYPLAHYARKSKLKGCFAICLQSTFSPHDCCVVELFLPPSNITNATLETLLCPLLATTKQIFPTLKVSSGEEVGDILSVEVIEVTTTDERNHTIICETTTSPPRLEALQNKGEAVHLDSSDQQFMILEDTIQNRRDVIGAEENNTTITISSPRLEALPYDGEAVHLDLSDQQLIVEDTIQNERDVIGAEENNPTITTSPPRLETLQDEGEAVHLDSSDQQLIVEDTIQNGRDVIGAEENNTTIMTSPPRLEALQDEGEAVHLDSSDQQLILEDTIRNVIGPEENNTTIMLGKKHRTTKISITHDDLKRHYGMKLEDAAKSLGVSRSSLKRVLRELGIERWPTTRNKDNHSTYNLKNAKGSVQGNEGQVSQSVRSPKKPKTVAHTVIIKATCGDDIIKFLLSVQSGIAKLREEVAKRLNIELRTFRLKYEDDAGDFVLITCDEDLQFCISSFSSSDCPIKMLILTY